MTFPILCVSRNNLALTKQTVRSALAQDVPVQVMLIDNASDDGTARWALTKDIVLVALTKQLSLAACWNLGLKALWKAGHEAALTCNNDVVLRPDTVRLLDAHGGPFVTCVSVDSEERLCYPEENAFERIKSSRPHPDLSCWLIRKSVTDQVGWFDEECWPAYCEDSFWHIKLHLAGIPAVCVDVPFLHYGASTLKHANAADKRIIEQGARRNRERFFEQHGCFPGSEGYQRLFQ